LPTQRKTGGAGILSAETPDHHLMTALCFARLSPRSSLRTGGPPSGAGHSARRDARPLPDDRALFCTLKSSFVSADRRSARRRAGHSARRDARPLPDDRALFCALKSSSVSADRRSALRRAGHSAAETPENHL